MSNQLLEPPTENPLEPIQADAADLEALEDRLDDLEAESAALPDRIREASLRGDVSAMLSLEARRKELPRWIAALKIQIERARVADLEARLPDLEKIRRAKAVINAESQERLKAAQREAQAAQNALADAAMRHREITWRIRELQREIEAAQAAFSSGRF